MGVIFMPNHLILKRLQCAHILSMIMHFHTGKYVLRCCADCPCINITDQETDNQYSETTPSIRFHIYHIIGSCTAHGTIKLKDKKYVTCVNKNLHQITLQKIHQ